MITIIEDKMYCVCMYIFISYYIIYRSALTVERGIYGLAIGKSFVPLAAVVPILW